MNRPAIVVIAIALFGAMSSDANARAAGRAKPLAKTTDFSSVGFQRTGAGRRTGADIRRPMNGQRANRER
jgi:hypothetical protein